MNKLYRTCQYPVPSLCISGLQISLMYTIQWMNGDDMNLPLLTLLLVGIDSTVHHVTLLVGSQHISLDRKVGGRAMEMRDEDGRQEWGMRIDMGG